MTQPFDDLHIQVKKVRDNATKPTYDHKGEGNGRENAGADLYSCVDATIEPGEAVTVPTGYAFAIPQGYGGFVHPRSSLSGMKLITIPNAPGTIDAGYRGEVKVRLYNAGKEPFNVSVGDRVAQLVVQRVEYCVFDDVDELDETVRGDGGFGSTGK